MKIIFTSFLFLLIISSALNSDCTDKKATDSPTSSSTDSGNPSGPSQPASTDDSGNNEENPSDDETEEGDEITDTTRLRILSSLTDDDCKNLKTNDDKKYQCVVSSDKSKCEEVEKESSSLLYLSLTYLIIFVIL